MTAGARSWPITTPATAPTRRHEDDAADNRSTLDFTTYTVVAFRLLGIQDKYDHFGGSLASGDFDGDSAADLAVGAPFESLADRPQGGVVFTFRGGSDGFSPWQAFDQWDSTDPQDPPGLDFPQEGDRFGLALAAGDVDGDGRADLAIGAAREDRGESESGLVSLYKGRPNGGPTPWLQLHQEL